MLGKLIKYNNKSIARIMLPIYLILLATTVSTTILVAIPNDSLVYKIFMGISIFTYVISIIALLAGSTIAILVHYYRSTICDQAYFTFSLPATISQHLTANTIAGTIWLLLSVALSFASFLLVFFGYNKGETIHYIKEFIHYMILDWNKELGNSSGLALFLFVMMMLISLVLQMINFQLCFAAGQTFRGHKLIGSFVVYIISYFIMELILMIPLVITILINPMAINTLFDIYPLLFGYLILYVLFAIVSFVLAKYFFSRKLNLE